MILVELCAGSAALSCAWLSSRATPPVAWLGSKRGYAGEALPALGLQPGGGRCGRVVLVEPGPWGEAWEVWRTQEGRAHTIAQLQGWLGEDPRALWHGLRDQPVPEELHQRVAVWAALQWWSFGHKPVIAEGGRWRTAGFDPAKPYRAEAKRKALEAGNEGAKGWADKSQLLDMVITALQRLPSLEGLEVRRQRAQDVDPIPGSLVIIDPPYKGTTCEYGHLFPREEVLQVAQRWGACARVAIFEQEPLPLQGWHHHQLGSSVGFGRTFSAQQQEWLTLNFAPAGQLRLWGSP